MKKIILLLSAITITGISMAEGQVKEHRSFEEKLGYDFSLTPKNTKDSSTSSNDDKEKYDKTNDIMSLTRLKFDNEFAKTDTAFLLKKTFSSETSNLLDLYGDYNLTVPLKDNLNLKGLLHFYHKGLIKDFKDDNKQIRGALGLNTSVKGIGLTGLLDIVKFRDKDNLSYTGFTGMQDYNKDNLEINSDLSVLYGIRTDKLNTGYIPMYYELNGKVKYSTDKFTTENTLNASTFVDTAKEDTEVKKVKQKNGPEKDVTTKYTGITKVSDLNFLLSTKNEYKPIKGVTLNLDANIFHNDTDKKFLTEVETKTNSNGNKVTKLNFNCGFDAILKGEYSSIYKMIGYKVNGSSEFKYTVGGSKEYENKIEGKNYLSDKTYYRTINYNNEIKGEVSYDINENIKVAGGPSLELNYTNLLNGTAKLRADGSMKEDSYNKETNNLEGGTATKTHIFDVIPGIQGNVIYSMANGLKIKGEGYLNADFKKESVEGSKEESSMDFNNLNAGLKGIITYEW